MSAKRLAGVAVVYGSCLIPAASGQEPAAADTARLALKTERVVVFKDGYALFVKSATGTADAEGRVYTEEVPDAAVLGTFWVARADGAPPAMRAERVETKERRVTRRPCVTLAELLEANEGRLLTLALNDGPGQLTGTIVEVLTYQRDAAAVRTPPPPHYATYGSAAYYALGAEVAPEPPRGGQYVVVDEAQAGRVVLPVSSIQRILGPVETTFDETATVSAEVKRLTFELGKESAGRPAALQILYFQPGVRWIPTYRLTGIDPGPARLALQAELLNEAEDIDTTALDVVVGFPNFRFKEVASPLSLEAALRNALAQAAPSLANQAMSNAGFSQRAGESRGIDPASERVPGATVEISGSGEQDLFVYPLGAFSLKKGARAAVPVWEQDVPCRHVYTADVAVKRESRLGAEDARFDGPVDSPLRMLTNQVWHQLELQNSGAAPWTTGSLLMLQGALPLAQELLTYTSLRGRTLVPVTVAVDVRAVHREQETERALNELNWNGTHYARISKKGEMTVTNRRGEPIDLWIALAVPGRVTAASDGGRVALDDYRPGDWNGDSNGRVNNHSDVTWELKLAPGESRTVSYDVSYYVR